MTGFFSDSLRGINKDLKYINTTLHDNMAELIKLMKILKDNQDNNTIEKLDGGKT